MLKELEDWFIDVSHQGNDPPPIELGHTQSPVVHLPAHEGVVSGIIVFQGRMGWANDWLKNWGDSGAITWSIKVVEAQEYKVNALYESNSKEPIIEVIIDDLTLTRKIDNDIITAFLPSPDRIKRGEVYERHWNQLNIGTWKLEKGEYQISLKVKDVKMDNEVLIKGVEISSF